MIFEIKFNEAELVELIRKAVREEMVAQKTVAAPEKPNTLHSLKELADFLHISIATAQRYKNDDIIPYIQCGRKLIFNTNDVMAAMKKYSDR